MCKVTVLFWTLVLCNVCSAYAYPHQPGLADWLLPGQLTPPSSISSSFRAQGQHSCTDVLLEASLLACRDVAAGSEVQVWQCGAPGAAEGFLVLLHKRPVPAAHRQHHRNPTEPLNASRVVRALHVGAGASTGHSDDAPHNKHGHETFRIRIVGREIIVPSVQYCGSTAIARYSLGFPGSYHVEVLHLHSNFTFHTPVPLRLGHQPVPLRQDLFAASFTLSIAGAGADTRQPTQQTASRQIQQRQRQSCIGEICPLCKTHNSPGRWLVKASGLEWKLRRTCVAFNKEGACDWRNSTLAVDESGGLLQWQPYGCSYAPQTASALAACRSKLDKQICLIGDSQTRHLHNMVVRLLDSSVSKYPKPVAATNGTTIKTVTASDQVVYMDNSWGIPMDTANCSYVFWNFGQWPLSHWAHLDLDFTKGNWEIPWGLGKYSMFVKKLAQHMISQRQQHSNKQYRVTINSHPILHRQQDPGDDYRTTPMLLMYNKLASTIMDMHGIEVVDTFSIADPLLDVSYDGAHYLGNVGKAQAHLLLNILCSKHLKHAPRHNSIPISDR